MIWSTDQLRVHYSSLASPLTWYNFDMSGRQTGANDCLTLVKAKEVLNFDGSFYSTRRVSAVAPDGTDIPISMYVKLFGNVYVLVRIRLPVQLNNLCIPFLTTDIQVLSNRRLSGRYSGGNICPHDVIRLRLVRNNTIRCGSAFALTHPFHRADFFCCRWVSQGTESASTQDSTPGSSPTLIVA